MLPTYESVTISGLQMEHKLFLDKVSCSVYVIILLTYYFCDTAVTILILANLCDVFEHTIWTTAADGLVQLNIFRNII